MELERGFSSHGFRRTANDLLRRVAPGQVVRAITGHVTEEMTEHYSHVDMGERREASERAFARLVDGQTGTQTGTRGKKAKGP